MEQRRGHAKRAILVAACAVAVLAIGGAVAGIALTRDSGPSAKPLPTTGDWAPITVKRPAVPIIGGGIPVDIEPPIEREDFVTTIEPLPTGRFHYRMSIWNASNLGTITSFQWYPPIGSRIVKLLGSTAGRCEVKGLTGFGGAQFPTVVLNPTIICDRLQMKAPSCTCQGDGGSVAITFVSDKEMNGGSDDARVRTVSLQFERVPTFLSAGHDGERRMTKRPLRRPLHRPLRHRVRLLLAAAAGAGVLALAGCGGGSNVDNGGLTATERQAAQAALDQLQDSNIALQLTAMTAWTQNTPAACRIRQVSKEPATYEAYVFWIPWLAAEPYVWLNMKLTGDPATSTFDLGTAEPILPGGRLNPDGRTIRPGSADTTLLERYGAQQARKSQELLRLHAGSTLEQPGADCQLLKNGSLRLLPATKA